MATAAAGRRAFLSLCKEYSAGPGAADTAASLREDASCAICMDYFRDPVTVGCGHVFCLSCLSLYMEQSDLTVSCPRCRQRFRERDLKPNRELSAIAEVFQMMTLESAKRPEMGFCKGCGSRRRSTCQMKKTGVCPAWLESQEHTQCSVVPVAEGVNECKPDLLKCLSALQAALEEVLKRILHERKNASCCQNQFKSQRQQVELEFEELRQFLEEEERLLLARLDEEEKQTLKRIQLNIAKMEQQSSSLRKLIKEMEGVCQHLDGDLFKYSRSILTRCNAVAVQKAQGDSPEQDGRVQHFNQHHADLQKMVADFKEWRWARRHAVDVTLAPETAHPDLILSVDWKSVRDGETKQDLPKHPERFDHYTIVLGCERFTSGRHYWEVEVGYKTDWGLGVCTESASRKGRVTLLPEAGYWIVRLRDGNDYTALKSPITQIKPRAAPRAVGIFLDYEAGKVSFYNAEDKSHLFTFEDTFTQTLCPLFSPGVMEKGQNAGALRIRQVTKW